MAELLNLASGAPEQLDDASVYKALASGTHMPVGGAKVLISPEGRLVFSPASDFEDNVSKYGYKLPTQADLNSFASQEQYGEGTANELKAFAAGAVRGATFGATDYLLPKTGLTTKEALLARKELNPASSLAGEATGAVGSALLAPEAALTGRLARGTAAAGEAASAAFAKTLAGTVPRETIAAKVLGSGAEVLGRGLGSSIEGAAYGAGQAVSEAALGDPDLTAERVISHLGYGALLGGGLGSLLKTGEIAIPAAVAAARKTVGEAYTGLFGGMKEAAGPLEAGAERPSVWEPGVLTKGIVKAAAATGKEPEAAVLERIRQSLGESSLTLQQRAALERDFAGGMQKVYDGVSKASWEARSVARPQELDALLAETNAALPVEQLRAVRSTIRHAISEMEAEPGLYPARYPIKLGKIADDLDNKVTVLEHPLPEPSGIDENGEPIMTSVFNRTRDQLRPDMRAVDIFKALDETKQAIDDKIPWLTGAAGENADAVSLLRGVRGTIRESLEDENTWGAAAARQAAYNRAYSEFKAARDEFQKQFMRKKPEVGGFAYKVKGTRVKTFFNMINDSRGDEQREAFTKLLEKSRGLIDEVDNVYKNAPATTFDKKSIEDLFSQAERQAAQAHATVKEQPGGFGFFTDLASGVGPATAAGMMAGGPAAFATLGAKAAFSAMSNPEGAIQKLGMIQRAAENTASAVSAGAKAAVDGTQRATKSLPGAGLLGPMLDQNKRRERFQKRTDDLRQWQDPKKVVDRLELATRGGYIAAPATMAALQKISMRGLRFLSMKIPAQLRTTMPFDAPHMPSMSEVNRFDRYYDAVEKPLSVLDELAGGTVSDESIEAVQEVYPQLFGEMQKEVISTIATRLQKPDSVVPYQQRIALSKFLGQPLTASLLPENIAANQLVLNKSQAEEDAKEKAQTTTEVAAPNVANQYLTPMQRAEERRNATV